MAGCWVCDSWMVWFRVVDCCLLCFELVSFAYLFRVRWILCRCFVAVIAVNSVVFFFSFM